MSELLHNGTVHSTAQPYAEAMVVENGQISWLGSDETAERMDTAELTVTDLDRGLVAPAFVGLVSLELDSTSPATVEQTLDDAAQTHGYAALRLVLGLNVHQLQNDQEATGQKLREVLTAAAEHRIEVWPVVELSGVTADGGAPSIQPVNELLDLLETVEIPGRQVAVALDLTAVAENLLGVRSWCAEAGRQLLLNTTGADPEVVVEAVVTTQKHLRELKQTPSPATPTVLVGFDSTERSHWEELLNTGVHVLLTGPGHLVTALSVGVPVSAAPEQGQNPWQLISDHVHHPQAPVSVRAGFNAQCRGAYRSLPDAPAGAGQLNPGSEATYVIWEVDSLAVQTPNSTVSAWSTDTRARTPLLPFLDGETLPKLVSTVIKGR
ncbi:hypothetical protein HGQ17_01320 [Nesterenkonia sp. MY13]|uniref:Amidohydrolase-related domain-containing protein n=1 Tax=Nesterenkonia sedimenti TaxID=1463632 RepID=A0A7X8YCK2_9MICC|nr:hypothetical protein [Nesterenkonia sedimenti]NLS08664.1 hypothetical protein [Nesterenkonia sedimenti]